MLLPSRVHIVRGPWHFGDFRNILLPNIGKDQKKVFPIEPGAAGSVPYGKSGPGYCISFIKRLDDGLGYQLLGQKSFILLGCGFKLVGKNWMRGPGPPDRQSYW